MIDHHSMMIRRDLYVLFGLLSLKDRFTAEAL